jgi:DNA polymerase-3 subunit alpha
MVLPEEYKGPDGFVHLHSHSVYSALDGVATVQQYADVCLERGWPGVALTEHGHMASVPDLYLTFRECGLKPIFGSEIYFNDFEPARQELEKQGIKVRSRSWRAENPEAAARISRNRHLTVLCKNKIGFENLIKLTTQAYKTGLFGVGRMQFNRIWFEKLCEYREGLIILSGCLNGPVSHELRYRALKDREGNIISERTQKECLADAIKYIKKFKSVFGEDYYIELQMPGIPEDGPFPSDVTIFNQLLQLAEHYKIKTVLTNDCHYLARKDFVLQKIMMAVAQETTIDSPDLFHFNSDEQYVKTRAELWSRYRNEYAKDSSDAAFESMCDNTLEIIDKCQSFNVDSNPKIPERPDADNYLRGIVARELRKRGLDKITEKFLIDGREVTYVEQASIELKRFIDKGFANYFIITRELVQFGKQNGWPFSPRGSAGGSLVCYLLDIHVLDPMKWGLSFDRFLSPSRGGYMLNVKMPEPVN